MFKYLCDIYTVKFCSATSAGLGVQCVQLLLLTVTLNCSSQVMHTENKLNMSAAIVFSFCFSVFH